MIEYLKGSLTELAALVGVVVLLIAVIATALGQMKKLLQQYSALSKYFVQLRSAKQQKNPAQVETTSATTTRASFTKQKLIVGGALIGGLIVLAPFAIDDSPATKRQVVMISLDIGLLVMVFALYVSARLSAAITDITDLLGSVIGMFERDNEAIRQIVQRAATDIDKSKS
jgi:hypothetical protein